jgi:hypothetical protein
MGDTLAPQSCPTIAVVNTKYFAKTDNFSVRFLGNRIMFPPEFVGKSFSLEILDLQGRLARKIVFDRSHPATQAERIDLRRGPFLIKCSMGNHVTICKVVNIK